MPRHIMANKEVKGAIQNDMETKKLVTCLFNLSAVSSSCSRSTRSLSCLTLDLACRVRSMRLGPSFSCSDSGGDLAKPGMLSIDRAVENLSAIFATTSLCDMTMPLIIRSSSVNLESSYTSDCDTWSRISHSCFQKVRSNYCGSPCQAN
jgi:hypothetical protein